MRKSFYVFACALCLAGCSQKAPEVFENAEWIGTDEVVLNASALGEFALNYDVQLQDPKGVAVFYFGGNDERVLNRNLNHMGVESRPGEVYMSLKLEGNKLSVTRRGFEKDSREMTLESFSLPEAWTAEPLHIRSDVELGKIMVVVNDSLFGTVTLNPNGKTGGDYIPYPLLGELACAGEASFKNVEIRNLRSPFTLYYQAESLEPSKVGDPIAFFDPSNLGMPVLRSALAIEDKPIKCATLYATARGIYEMYINGQRVGNDFFAPGCTQYNKTHYYQTYDIKPLLSAGQNDVKALLGEGWWMGTIGYWAHDINHFGDQLALLAQIVVQYEDGSQSVLVTNDKDWQVSTQGAIRYSNRFNGEVFDARLSVVSDDSWKPAQVMSLEGHLPYEASDNLPGVDDYSAYELLPQPDEGVQVREVLTAQSVKEVRPGVFVYDMGQNMAGLPEITFSGLEVGQKVRMRFAEVCYPDMKEYAINKGMVMMENMRAAASQDIYFAKGKASSEEASGEASETFAPHFTLHGYRFVEITGIKEALPLEAVKGRVLSSVRLTSGFECSNPLVNRLFKNIQWSTLGNFISIPTDCPQRNERMGWGGDISVFSRTATYMADNYEFLRRHTRNIRDCQTEQGQFPDVAPINGGFGGFLWGSSGITVPYEIWRQTGRTEVLSENYDAMVRYMDFVANNYIEKETGLLIQSRAWGGLADWLNLEYDRLDKSCLYECYYIFDLEIMAEMAQALGKEADAQAYMKHADERKAFFLATYVDAESGKVLYSDENHDLKGQLCDYQASYVLPLAFGIVEDEALRKKMTDNLVAAIERENSTDEGVKCPPYSLMTGFITTAWINKALTDNGRADVAYRLLQSTTYPSWLYPVTQGATTIWERLNSYNDFEGFGNNNSMNSFNHYSFGAVGQWLFNRTLGIERDDKTAGFKHFVLRPVADPTRQMTFARGWFESAQGMIRSSWEYVGDKIKYNFSIPEGCSATLLLPGEEPKELSAGEYEYNL